jgi:hypothetical protein
MMSSLSITLVAFAIIFGGGVAGMLLRSALPNHHLRDDSRDVIKLANGLVGTMAALVLGLLVASAKGFYDAQTTEITQMSANIVYLDRGLDRYGPETKEARDALRTGVEGVLNQLWSKNLEGTSRLEPTSVGFATVYDKIEALTPTNDLQRSIRSQALNMAVSIGQTRWLMYEQGSLSVSKPMLAIMIFWLTVTFVVWGLLSAPNPTIVITMLVAALSVSGAILLLLEMYSPYEGIIRVSDAPIRAALAHLGH